MVKRVKTYKSEFVEHPLYNLKFNGMNVSLLYSPSGASMAAGVLEEAIAGGVKYIVALGSCGVLDDIGKARVFIPQTAFRDEGTSYHYVNEEEELAFDKRNLRVIRECFSESNLDYTVVKTWSTDGLFRLPQTKVKNIIRSGCQIIDMECSALLAVSKYHNVKFGQFFYSDYNSRFLIDDSEELKERKLIKNELIWIAVEACLMM